MINNFTLKVSALVTFEDNSVLQILSNLDENGNIAVNYSGDHVEASSSIDHQTDAMTDFAFTDTDTGLSFSIGHLLDYTPEKTVTSVILDVSARFANEDDTWNDFLYQFNSVEGSTPLIKQGTAYAARAVNDTTTAQWALVTATFAAANITLTVI